MKTCYLWLLIVLSSLVIGCTRSVNIPEETYQSAADLLSRSLATVDPEESLHLFTYDPDAPLDIQEVERWRTDHVTYIDLTYASPKGGRVPATLMIPDGRGPFAGMVFMHGTGGSRKNFHWQGAKYAHLGAVSIAIDAPYIRPDHYIKTEYMSGSWPRWNETDRDEQIQLILDLQRAVDILTTRPEVDSDRIAFLGYSYGGAMGGLFAGVERRLQAYVLMVGDGGLVEHLSDPDDQGYPIHWSERWLDVMWPIEPLHFVGRAAPAAILYQNGVLDQNVPVRDSVRYQLAGSQPKEIIWYDSDHYLPGRAFQDGAVWLQKHIGPNLFFLAPNYRPSALVLDRLLLMWFALTLGSLGFVIWDLNRFERGSLSEKLIWPLAFLFIGPLGLLAYFLSYRPQRSTENHIPVLAASRIALGSVTHCTLGNIAGFAIGLAIIIEFPRPDSRFLSTWLYSSSLIMGVLIVLISRLVLRPDASYRISIPRSLLVGFISSNMVLSGIFPVMIVALNRWIPFEPILTSPFLWVIFSLATISGVLTGYPLHVWFVKGGYIHWEAAQPGYKANVLQGISIGQVPRLKFIGLAVMSYVIMISTTMLSNMLISS